MKLREFKSILITGASSGIGQALAIGYATPGIQMCLSGRNGDRLLETAIICRDKGAVVSADAIDVCDATAMRQWIEAFDDRWPLDLVVANAGVSFGTAGGDGDAVGEQLIRAINIDGVANTVNPVLPRMVSRRNGQLALMSSLAGFRGLPNSPAYSASKAWVLAYGQALRGRYASTGIGISVICPGFVASRITEQNDFSMPGFMDAAAGAAIIRQGLAQNRGVIAFPRQTAWPARLVGILPTWLTDPIFARLPDKE